MSHFPQSSLSRWGSVQDSVDIARALEFRTCYTRGNDRSKALLREHPSGVKTEPSLLHTDMYKFYLKERNRSKPLKQFELKDIFGHPEAGFYSHNFFLFFFFFSFNNCYLEILTTGVTKFMIQNVPRNWLLYPLKTKGGQTVAYEITS